MFKHIQSRIQKATLIRRRRQTDRKAKTNRPPLFDVLETRVVPSTITWDNTNHPTGGDWDTTANWIGGKVPTGTDTAVINLTGGTVTHNTSTADAVLSITANATTTISLSNGSLAIGNAISTLNNNLSVTGAGTLTLSGSTLSGTGTLTVAGNVATATTGTATLALSTITLSTGSVFTAGSLVIAPGTTMNVGSSASFVLQGSQTLTDNGTINFNSGDTVSLARVFNTTTQLVVNGSLTASATNFVDLGSPSGSASVIVVNAGGHLTASNSTFAVDQLTLNNGAVLNAGDLNSDGFDLPIFVPFSAIPLLTNNRRFEDINIQSGTLPSPQTLALNTIGSDTTANLRYVFPAGFTVASGATINVGPNVPFVIGGAQTFVDNGTVAFTSGDSVGFVRSFNTTTQLTVNGSLTASSASFVDLTTPSNSAGIIQVNSGGHLTASNSTFGIDQLNLNSGSILTSGDLSGDGFDLPLFVPFYAVPFLTNNRRFQDINILNGTLPAGQSLSLAAIGADTTANLRYVFPAGFTVASGATINVGPNVPFVIGGAQTFVDNGNVAFSSGDSVGFVRSFNTTTELAVNGSLTAASASFVDLSTPSSSAAVIQVNAGGHLTASNSTFGVDQLTLNSGSVLNSGDLVANGFDLPLFVPFTDVSLLANNRRLEAVNILSATMSFGQTLALNLMGTDTTANLQYVFPAGFTVASGATLTVGANVNFLLQGAQTFTDNGTMTFSGGDTATFVRVFNSTTLFSVGGTLNASSTSFVNSGNPSGALSQIQVGSGGHLNMSGGSSALDSVNLLSGAAASISGAVFSGQLAVNSAATVAISGNDFSNVPAAGVIASGDPTATIALPNNWWGSTNTTQIAAKIKDHVTDSTRPTINFVPFAGAKSGINANSVTSGYSTSAHSVTLGAAVSSPLGTVNEGTVTFTVFNNGTQIGTPVSGSVSGGLASAPFSVPAGTPIGVYMIQAVYVDNSNSSSPFAGSTDTSHLLTITSANTTTTGANATATFSASTSQTIPVSATIGSGGGSVGEGTAMFTVLNGGTVIGAPVSALVSAGASTANYTLPLNTPAGVYTIQVAYTDPGNYQGSSDSAHFLTVNPALTTAAGNNASAFYSAAAQTIQVTASVSSSAGTVAEGSVAFTILNGANVVGNPVSGNVVNGAVTTNYVLPGGLQPGSYTMKVAYSGSNDFQPFTDNSHQLTITAASTITTAASATATFSTIDQFVALSATVLSGSAAVNEGSETFTILNGGNPVGSPVTVGVVGGAANATVTLPGGTAAGAYTIQATYTDPANFVGTTDATHHLTVTSAPTTTTASNTSASYSAAAAQLIPVSAQVTSSNGSVNEGSVMFTVLNGTTVIGAPVSASVASGVATTNFSLPAGTAPKAYTLKAVYTDPTNFVGSSDTTHQFVVSSTTTTTASSATAPYSAAASELVTLNASVTSPSGAVNEGIVTFTVMNGATAVGNPVTAPVTSSAASTIYSLPAATAPGSYTIQAVYTDPAAYAGSSDSAHKLTVGQGTTSTAATNASTVFSAAGQSVTLVANVNSSAGAVNEGTITFSVQNAGVTVGSPVTVSVSAGSATAGYALPPGTPAGTYTILANYNGTTNFQGSSDNTHTLLIAVAPDLISAANSSVTYSSLAQSAQLSASVTSSAGAISEGTVSFKILTGATLIGTPVSMAVSAGTAIASYALPPGLSGGTYTIEADYHGAGNFQDQSDTSHTLIVAPAAVSNVAASTSAPYNAGSQTVALTASVTSTAGAVNEGTETFKVLSGANVVGAPVTVNVANSAAGASYTLPPSLAGGSYVIQAIYSGTPNFQSATDSTHVLTINPAATQTAATGAGTLFNTAAQTVTLAATVTSPAGTVNEGSETFTVMNGGVAVGSPVTVSVASGAASANYSLPAGTAPGTYTIEVDYNGTGNFQSATDSSHHLTVSAAKANTAAADTTVTFQTTSQSVPLSATVTSNAGIVSEGSEMFTILSGTTVIGTAVSANVINGAASTTYTLPAGTAPATYTIQAAYSGTVNYQGVTDTAHQLIVNPANTTTLATAASVAFSTSSQSVTLIAAVTSGAGPVNGGTLTFTIEKGATTIGAPVSANVSAGSASASYGLPANLAGGSYTIQASYGGTTNFVSSGDSAHMLTVAPATTTTSANKASLTINSLTTAHQISLSATILSAGEILSEGSVTFKIQNGSTVIGTAVSQGVLNGSATANYTLPAGTRAGSYTIVAAYSGTANFAGSSDTSHTFKLSLQEAPGDFDGDGKTDLAVYDQTQSTLTITLSGGGTKSTQFGNPAHVNIPVFGDFDGDGKADTGVYDQTVSQFFILESGGGALTPQFGNPAHINIPVTGDFDGDGRSDLAIYDQTVSQFFILLSGGGAKTPQFGNPSHVNIPVVGDFDGDGKADIGIYDETAGQFFILLSGGGAMTPSLGNPARVNVPVAGNFEANGKADIGIYDQTAGQFTVLLSSGGPLTLSLGNPGHFNIPLLGDYNGDGKTDLGIYDQSASQFLIQQTNGTIQTTPFGNATHVNIPVPAVFLGASQTKSFATRSASIGVSAFDLASSARSFGRALAAPSPQANRAAVVSAQGTLAVTSARPAQVDREAVKPWALL
jgi:hypothetical protein